MSVSIQLNTNTRQTSAHINQTHPGLGRIRIPYMFYDNSIELRIKAP